MAIASVGLVAVLEKILVTIDQSLSIPVPIAAPSAFLVFALIYGGFNGFIWNISYLRKAGLMKVPNLNGEWEGYIETSYDGENMEEEVVSEEDNSSSQYTKIEGELKIEQKWDSIQIRFESEQSSSESTGATILVNKSSWPTITYQYRNKPEVDTPDTMNKHDGTADLELKEENGKKILEGLYYTGPGRENHGKMYFERKS